MPVHNNKAMPPATTPRENAHDLPKHDVRSRALENISTVGHFFGARLKGIAFYNGMDVAFFPFAVGL